MTNAFGPGLLGTICTLDYWILGLQLAGKMNVFVWLMKRINIHCKSDQSSRHSLSLIKGDGLLTVSTVSSNGGMGLGI